MARRVLVSWLGLTDLRAMIPSLSKNRVSQLGPVVKHHFDIPEDGRGPIGTLLAHEKFDEVHLLSNSPAYPAWVSKAYCSWLAHEVRIHVVTIKNPTDYEEVYNVADASLKKILKSKGSAGVELSLFLTPGTPTMAAIWVLLGGTLYPATLWQAYAGKPWITKIPFDLTVDVIPAVLRDSDSAYHHLSSDSPQDVDGFGCIIGDSKAIRLAVGLARRAALRDVSVLLLGESGTGKEMFARAIHAASRRKKEPFECVNCAAIPDALMESELFGHARGGFTGAIKNRDGAFKRAHKGTLFLDEIGECAPTLQAKLLRVLEPPPHKAPCHREILPVGSDKMIRCDVRIIAATNRDLLKDIGKNRFRADLYYRMAAISLQLPPLRERRSDIPLLAQSFLDRINRDFESVEPEYRHRNLSVAARSFMKEHAWPGNARQLKNVILQAAVMSEGTQLTPRDIRAGISDPPAPPWSLGADDQPLGHGFVLEDHLNSVGRQYIEKALAEAHGVKAEAARLLGYRNYQTLAAKMKRLGIS